MKCRMKKITIFFLLMTYLLSVCSITASADTFPDVPRTHKNYLAITRLDDLGVITGYEDGSFNPQKEITRTEFCALMARTLGCDKATYVFDSILFDDVKPDYWGEWCIAYCYEKTLINGMGNNEFWPASPVTLEQAVKMAVCAIGKEAEAQEIVGEKWYDGYIEVANKYNLFYKVDGEIGKPAVRATVAQIVYNMLESGLVPQEDEEPENNEPDNSEVEPDDEADGDVTGEEDNNEEEPEEEHISPEIIAAYREKDFLDVRTILIDAGHNYKGRDTGAENKSLDLKEEEVTWQIADKLRSYLEEMGYNVVMTRDKITDSIANTSVLDSLQARVDLGHQSLADLFISIHCNAGGGSGTEVYCFSKNSYAGHLAEIVQDNIVAETGLYDRGVKTANFFVIQNTLMPAILIETGFIDNSKDAAVLSSEAGQNAIATAVAVAVREYDSLEAEDFAQSNIDAPSTAAEEFLLMQDSIEQELNTELDELQEEDAETPEDTVDEIRGTEDEE